MRMEDAVYQLDKLEGLNGKAIPLRTRRLILQAVATGTAQVGVHGISVDVCNAGIKVAVSLLNAHPCAWLESIPDTLGSVEKRPLGQVSKPQFGL